MRFAVFRHSSTLVRAIKALAGADQEIIVSPPSWRIRCGRWFVAMVVCAAVFQLYCWVVVPWIEPPSRQTVVRSSAMLPTVRVRNDEELKSLFPPGAWELDNPKELKTPWGRLFFQRFKRIDQGVELEPCTILFRAPTEDNHRDGDSDGRTIVLKTPQRAVISFSGNMNLVRAQMGELKGAVLEGEVHIYARESRAGANDALNIVTHTVQIEPTKIWTPHDVAFEYGDSRGSGRVLTISLTSSEEKRSNDDSEPFVQNVEMLQLVHLDRLHLEIPGKGLLGNTGATANDPHDQASAQSQPNRSTAVDVTCEGPFRFDFREGIATLQDHVAVVRQNPGIESDQLLSDRLRIFFRNDASIASLPTDANGNPNQPTSESNDTQSVSKMTISRIEATGSDVILQVPSFQTLGRGQLLQYDFRTRRILLQDPQKAVFAYRQHVVESPGLEYELGEQPSRLGKLWATGPGLYRGAIGKEPQTLQATWKGTLQLQPQDDHHVLSVTQGAEINWGQTGRFTADKLFVWLAEVIANDQPPAAGVAVLSTPQPAGPPEPEVGAASGLDLVPANSDLTTLPPEKERREVVPVKLLAQGRVQARSEQFSGDTSQLEIWFDRPLPGTAGVSATADAAQPPAQPIISSPANVVADGQKAPKHLELSGTQIRLRLWMVRPQPKVREATVSGEVRLAQLTPGATDSASLLVTGDSLQLQVDALQRAAIDVHGEADGPARVHAQGMLLEGANLHVSQRENLVWSEGPGRTKLPAQKRSAGMEGPAAAAQTATAPIWISWQGGMDFDGQLIRFMKQVRVSGIHVSEDGEQNYLQSIGDELHAVLNRYVELSRTRDTDGLDVAELRFLGDVFTENRTFDAHKSLTSHDRMKARDLALDRSSGQFSAVGPGWITSTRVDNGELNRHAVGDARPSPLPQDTLPQDTLPQDTPSANQELVFLRIDFQNAIQGNLDLREGEFVHYVRTLYGPVAAWDQELDPNRQGGLGPDGVVMTCGQLKVVQMSQQEQRWIELSAVGNTVIEGSQFLAKADRLNYVEAKNQLIFEAADRNFASLQRRSRIGEQPAEFQAKKILYGLKSGQIEVFGARQLDYNQLGTPAMPSARIR